MRAVAQIGWIGLGIMGSRQAANLRRAGHELTVWNRTQATAEAWAAEHGATVAASPAEVAERCDIVFSMVVDGPQVEEVLVPAAREGVLFVDMSTIGAQWTRRIGEQLTERGARLVDAPVTGSAPRAQDGTLAIMCGGDPADVERVRPLLDAMGSLIVYAGPLGAGQAVKLINNSVAAANAGTVAQALLVGAAQGLDLDALVEVMSAGSGASAMLALKAAPMREHDYSTLFKVEHMLKDVRLCLEEAEAAGAPFPAAAAARDALAATFGRGHGQDDFAAVLEAFEGYAGRRL
ncbi:MAG: 3-hydroxyisobutyrate dehydrogenase [Solirubrobacteraceae bacterium]|nr:3-hydroxyisobutyrate dehydrogenase [Solirubrobacteraceae bacterium]